MKYEVTGKMLLLWGAQRGSSRVSAVVAVGKLPFSETGNLSAPLSMQLSHILPRPEKTSHGTTFMGCKWSLFLLGTPASWALSQALELLIPSLPISWRGRVLWLFSFLEIPEKFTLWHMHSRPCHWTLPPGCPLAQEVELNTSWEEHSGHPSHSLINL